MAWFKDRMVAAGQISTRKLTVVPVIPDFTAVAESGNAISVLIQLVDPDGNNVARAVDLLCVLRKSDGLIALVGEFTLAETGDGTAVSTTAKPSLIVTTDAEGQCTIAVTDVSGAYTANAYLEVTPLNTLGSPGIAILDFN
jgi:hypothetical protein